MLLLGAYPRHALLWSSLPLYWSCFALTGLTPDHPPHITPTLLMSIGAIYISSILSLTLLTHLTHSYLLSPHLIFHDSESAYSFYFCPPPMFIIRVHLCAGPALNYVVFNVQGLLLTFPSLSIDLSQLHLSSLQQPSFQES